MLSAAKHLSSYRESPCKPDQKGGLRSPCGLRSPPFLVSSLCLDTSDAVGGFAEIAGNIFVQADVVDDNTRTGNAGNFAFQQVLHFDIGHIAVQADDVVFDQRSDVGRFWYLARL